MSRSSLRPLQRRLVRALAALEPPWTLTGGAALAGVYLGHRTTRDLDQFWRDRTELGSSVTQAIDALRAEGLDVAVLRTSPAFAELRASDGTDVCTIDLVAEPLPSIEAPKAVSVEGVTIAVDTQHEILAAKLAALLGRVELRDLQDIAALLDAGTDLSAALRDAPQKDTGFSPLTLAWVLESYEPVPLARALGWTEQQAVEIDRFRRELIDRLTRAAKPE